MVVFACSGIDQVAFGFPVNHSIKLLYKRIFGQAVCRTRHLVGQFFYVLGDQLAELD